jgi:hypothetical protein
VQVLVEKRTRGAATSYVLIEVLVPAADAEDARARIEPPFQGTQRWNR